MSFEREITTARRSRVSDDRTISKFHRKPKSVSQSVISRSRPALHPSAELPNRQSNPISISTCRARAPARSKDVRPKPRARCVVRSLGRPLPHRLAPNQRGMRWYCVFLFLYGFAIQIKLTHSYFLGTRHTHSDAYTCACKPSSLQLSY